MAHRPSVSAAGLYCYRNTYRLEAVPQLVLRIPEEQWNALCRLKIRRVSAAYFRSACLPVASSSNLPIPDVVREGFGLWLREWDVVESPLIVSPIWVRQVVLRNTTAVKALWTVSRLEWAPPRTLRRELRSPR